MSRGEFTAESAENAEEKISQYDWKGRGLPRRRGNWKCKMKSEKCKGGTGYRGGRGEKDGIGIGNL